MDLLVNELACAPLAFVDIETTGLSPRTDRIAEIGVVTVDGERVEEWSTFLNPSARTSEPLSSAQAKRQAANAGAPRFKDIAVELAARLRGRLMVAHNARFDYGFLKAEFSNVGMDYRAQVVCTAMLSRKLNAHCQWHDMDALMLRHNLMAQTRHRALPDARLVWQFWQVIHREHSPEKIADLIAGLLAGPVLPPGLDPLLVDKLPARPGVYIFHGENEQTLRVGSASNLKLQVQNYFRLDRMSVKAATTVGRIRNITWQATRGPFGAQLRATAIAGTARAPLAKFTEAAAYSWQFVPEAYPCVRLVDLGSAPRNTTDTFGIFASARKAQNQLLKMALQQPLCHRLLGIQVHAQSDCLACAQQPAGAACADQPLRLRHLMRCWVALTAWPRLHWPYPGAIGVRERGELHVCHAWRYLGSAATEPDIYALLQARRPPLDARMFALLSRRLPRVSRRNLIDLSRYGMQDSRYERDEGLA